MAKRKSTAQFAKTGSDPSTPRNPAKSTLIDDLNALNHQDFTSRFFTNTLQHNRNHCIWDTELYFARDLPSEQLQLCFKLIETTSRHDYEPSSFGWHPQRKKREMKEKEMRYVLLRNPGEALAGFMSFMFTHDSSPAVPVLYVYEVHLSEDSRGQGLGGFLMRAAEGIAREAGVDKVMLTCFVSNENAWAFYRKLGYEVDVCSPGDRTTRNKVVKVDYVIMSKDVSEGREAGGGVAAQITQAGSEDEYFSMAADMPRKGQTMNVIERELTATSIVLCHSPITLGKDQFREDNGNPHGPF